MLRFVWFNDSIPFTEYISKMIDKNFRVFALIKAVSLIFRRPT